MMSISSRDELIRKSLSYNQNDGSFIWIDPSSLKIKKGSVAGTTNNRGYRVISCGDKIYLAHRLAWFLYYGDWPNGNIDHINHDCADNRISNLRIASQKSNCKNQSLRTNNSSGTVGVWYCNRTRRWVSEIMVDYKKIPIGRFELKQDAIDSRFIAEKKYGFHDNHGMPKGQFNKLQREQNK